MAQAKCINCMNDFDISQSTVCPHCGYDQSTPKKESYHLDPGYMLNNRYIIGNAIGSGGFGITYIAWDTVLEKKVAIKEYFPTEFGTRLLGDTEVCPYDGEKSYQFEAGLNSFVDEALRLAKLNSLPHIVHIYDSFAANYTAYIIMDFVEGKTLMELLREKGPLPYEEVIKYIVPVLDVLDKVHQEHIIHRDIAPDNIKVNGDDVVLLDFGSARTATTHYSKSMSVLVKPGYSPWEQYSSKGNQGPWTDVYAIAAVMYHLITGKIPKDSCYRVDDDDLKTPTEMGFPIPEKIENAIMNALNVKPEYRIQSAKEFADALRGDIELERVLIKTKDKTVVKLSKKTKIGILAGAVAAVAAIIIIIASTSDISKYTADHGKMLPDLSSMKKAEAIKTLDSYGIDYMIVGTYELKGTKEGEERIAYQDIPPQTPIEDVTRKIKLKVAKAPIKRGNIPSLSGQTVSEAKKTLKDAGFNNYEFIEQINNNYKEGLVFKVSPEVGKRIPVKNKVTVYYAKNVTTTTTRRYTTYRYTTKYTPPATTKKYVPPTTKPPVIHFEDE